MRGGVMSARFVEEMKIVPFTESQFVFQINPGPGAAGAILLNAPE
jgi:hypothetical protein